MSVTLPTTGPYTAKDQRKANAANKFIGRGSPSSSTNAYAAAYGGNANCGAYTQDDVVFISAEGNRRGRLDPDFGEIGRACAANARFITDDPANRARPYNVGERQVSEFLTSQGYRESRPGVWSRPKAVQPPTKRPAAKRRVQREALAALVAEGKRRAPACEEFRFGELAEPTGGNHHEA